MNIITEIKPKIENNNKIIKFLNLHWGSENIVSKGKHNIFLCSTSSYAQQTRICTSK